jgi:hypothetical protein
MKIRKLLFVLFVALLGYISGYGQTTIYKHDFGVTTAALAVHPYNVQPAALNPNLSTSSWTKNNRMNPQMLKQYNT